MSDILLKLHEFEIRANTLYEITEKTDSNAPDGFKENKTSKVLHPDVDNTVPGAVFDSELGIWDTGTYDNSRALMKAIPSAEERSKFVKDVTKYIVTPLQKLRGKDFLSPQIDNNSYWDKFMVKVARGRIFNTAKPEELLQLYLVLLHKQVTPNILESNPEFKNSQYCIIDKETSVDRTLEKEYGMMEAQATFFNLLKDKKKDLLLLLDYLRVSVSEKTEDRVLSNLFNNWLKDKTDGYQNYAVFIKTYKFFLTEDGEKEIFYHSKIKDLIKKGVIKQKKQEIWFEDEYLGSDLKASAKNIMGSKDLQTSFLKYIE